MLSMSHCSTTVEEQRPPPSTTARPTTVDMDECRRASLRAEGRTSVPGEAVVAKSSLKRKIEDEYIEDTGSNEQTDSHGFTEAGTPVSCKGGKVRGRLKAVKHSKSGPQAPMFDAGSPSPPLIPTAGCRYEQSLGVLTKKFIELLEHADNGILHLKEAAQILDVRKRRIYDITNVLEGIGVIEKMRKSRIRRSGFESSRLGLVDDAILWAEIQSLKATEQMLDDNISDIQERLREFTEDKNNQRWLYVSEDDIKALPCFQNDTLLAIKAHRGTIIEVPDPDEGIEYPNRRYRLFLRSTMGSIDVFLLCQYEKFKELKGVQSSATILNSESIGDPTRTTVTEKTKEKELRVQDTQWMTRIVPSEDTDADYWLHSDVELSTTDWWKSTPEAQRGKENRINIENFPMSTSMPGPPDAANVTFKVPSIIKSTSSSFHNC